jgi:hypothetical protein
MSDPKIINPRAVSRRQFVRKASSAIALAALPVPAFLFRSRKKETGRE